MSPIRASNQFSPKTKVVDFSFLYNFYFGQISCSHMKFGVLSGQTLVKINEMKSSSLLCSRRRMCADGNSGSDATRRTSANLASHARAPSLSLSRSRVRFPLPFFSIAQQGAEPLEPRRRPPLRPSSPPPPDSPRPKPRDFAPKLLRPSTNSFAPIPGRIEAPDRRSPSPSPPNLALAVDDPLSGLLPLKSSRR